jgi:hypothetical protein
MKYIIKVGINGVSMYHLYSCFLVYAFMFENHQKLGLCGFAIRKKEKKYSTKKKVSGNTKYGKLLFLFKLYKQKFALDTKFCPEVPRKEPRRIPQLLQNFRLKCFRS